MAHILTLKMKIVNEKPPIYNKILNSGMHPHEGVIYTYGDTIYNPSGTEISDHLLEHEEVHHKQQGSDPGKWWDRYLNDQYFRIEQEAEAYAHQYDYLCKRIKDRNQRARILFDLARILSSSLYGSVIGQVSAMGHIKSKVIRF